MWPPSYYTPAASASADPAPVGAPRGYPPPGWPSKDQLDYTVKGVTALLLVLALPWLTYKLLTEPSEVLAGAAYQHIRPR